jgi:hypothetical protein
MILDNKTIRLTPDAPGAVQVSWTSSHPDWPAWLFVDGKFVAGPQVDDPAQPERSIAIRWTSGETHALEIQELPTADLVPTPITIEPNTTPEISWNALATAERYRLYHRTDPAGTDALIFDGFVQPDEFGICRLSCPITLDGRGGRWQFFRVEAVDAFGNESTRLSWVYWATQPDDVPKLAISAGSAPGLYNLMLNAEG